MAVPIRRRAGWWRKCEGLTAGACTPPVTWTFAGAAGSGRRQGKKNSNWEGAYRVPCMVRWPRNEFFYFNDDAGLRHKGVSERATIMT
jgi:hypothetical protein